MEEVKYDKFKNEWQKCIDDESKKKLSLTWLEGEGSLDRWRHQRIYNLLKPLVNLNKKKTWVTIGDGRYGTDANALIKMGVEKVLCTDLSAILLKKGKAAGFIKEFSEENGECLSFEDYSFDYVLCKEAYHHFPRPSIALYEMMRVCKIGVVLIEPNDSIIDYKPLSFIVPLVKNILGQKANMERHEFEDVGNYCYRVSKREIEKFQLGMHRRYVAFKGINDYYEKGVEFIKMNTKKNKEKRIIFKSKFFILVRNLLSKFGLVSDQLLASILFKEKPSKEIIEKLKFNGWEFKVLPKNPYL